MKKATTKSNAKSAKDRRREKREYHQLFKENYFKKHGKPKKIEKWILYRYQWSIFWNTLNSLPNEYAKKIYFEYYGKRV